MQKKYKDKGVLLVALSYESSSLVAPYVKGMKLPYIVGDEAATTRDAFGIDGYPTMFLVDPDGKVAWKGHPVQVEEQIKKLIAKNPPKGRGLLGEEAAKLALKKAEEHLRKKQYVKAVSGFEELVKSFKSTEAGRTAKAHLKKIKGNKRIMASIRKAEAEKKAKSWLNSARLMAKHGAHNDAARYYKRIIDECPDTEFAELARKEMSELAGGGRS